MQLQNKFKVIIGLLIVFFSACNNPPESNDNMDEGAEDLHSVFVNETIPTSKYLYLHVTEKNEQYWIATSLQDIKVGEFYYYSSGILKLNFKSEELNRLFDKIYLVSSLVPVNHGSDHNLNIKRKTATPESKEAIEIENSILIAVLVENMEKYSGKRIQISGECVKVNPDIMGRNWIHLKDGSKDDYDLVVTSETYVPVGSVVTMTAVVSLKKDFGSGYSYELILEDGEVLP